MRKVIDQWTVFIYIFSVEMGKQMNVNNKNDSAHRKYTKKPNELVVAFNFLTPDWWSHFAGWKSAAITQFIMLHGIYRIKCTREKKSRAPLIAEKCYKFGNAATQSHRVNRDMKDKKAADGLEA